MYTYFTWEYLEMSDLANERQLQRLIYIDMCAYVLGFVNRKLLMSRFDIKQVWATKDFTEYQLRSGDSLVYDHGLKGYKPVEWFSPLFEHDVKDVIQLICEGRQSIICAPKFTNNYYSAGIQNIQPKLANIYNVLRSLNLSTKVEIEYISRSRGKNTRLVIPHSLIKTGSFTYVRGFDHSSGEFRNFKLNRIVSSKVINSKPVEKHMKSFDEDWNNDVKIVIKANEGLESKEAIEFDYGLENGRLIVFVKKALVLFFLMDLNIAPEEEINPSPILFPLVVDSILSSN